MARPLDQGEVAERTAYYVAQMRDAGMVASSLPSADGIVRACLDAIPVSLDRVAVLTDRQNVHALERQEMLDSRRAKNLLSAAEQHQTDLHDPDLADRLSVWLAIKPRGVMPSIARTTGGHESKFICLLLTLA